MAFDRAQSSVRWLVLALGCLGMFGSYYVYDNPTALSGPFQDQVLPGTNTTGEYRLSSVEYNLLYSVYSFPNTVLPFFGGFLVDKIGTRITLFAFLFFICFGQAIFAFGATLKLYWLMLVGRTVFGFGGESLSVAMTTILALWFRGKEMAFAMGLNLSVSRLGSVVNDQVSPAVYKDDSLPAALWVGFFICVASFGCGLGLIVVDRWAEKHSKEDDERTALLNEEAQSDPYRSVDTDDTFEVEVRDVTAMYNEDAGIQVTGEEKVEKIEETVSLSDVQYFSKSYWLLCVSCVIVYGTVLPFNNIASNLLEKKYGFELKKADRLLAIPFFISACASPFLGRIIDAFGKRVILLTWAAFSLMVAHGLFAFTMITPYVPLCTIGMAYSVYAAAVWPSVSFVVPEKSLGTAYGVITAIQNLGLATIPLIVGALTGSGVDAYKHPEMLFVAFGAVGVIIGFLLQIEDKKMGGVLNRAQGEGKASTILEVDSRDDPDLVEKYGPFTPQPGKKGAMPPAPQIGGGARKKKSQYAPKTPTTGTMYDSPIPGESNSNYHYLKEDEEPRLGGSYRNEV